MAEKYTLRYDFSLGERQTHRQITTLVLEQPDGSKAGGRVTCDMLQKVLAVDGDRYQIEFEQKVIEREGTLAEQVPLQLAEGRSQCWMSAQGALLEHMETRPSTAPSFPDEPLAPGELWTVRQPTPEGGWMEIHFRFEKVEDGLAHLVSHCQPPIGADGAQTEIAGSLKFRLQPGGAQESTTVILRVYPDGRKVHQVIQLQRQH